MKHFKHLRAGMSLIEVMFALALFAIFGSSIFMMQQYVFDRLMISQKKLAASLYMQQELAEYQYAILKEFFDYEKGSIKKSLQNKSKEFYHPDMTVEITTKSDFTTQQDSKESIFKDFKNLHLISVKAHEPGNKENLYGNLFVFVYIPELEKPQEVKST